MRWLFIRRGVSCSTERSEAGESFRQPVLNVGVCIEWPTSVSALVESLSALRQVTRVTEKRKRSIREIGRS